MKKRRFGLDFWSIVTIGILITFGLFLIYPLVSLFIDGFLAEETGKFTLNHFIRFFTKKYYYRSLINSLKLTACVTVCSLVIGVPLAYFMSFFKIRGKGILEILIIISMMSPNFIGAYSWILMLGRSGLVTTFLRETFGINLPSIYGFGGMLLVFSLKLYPFIYMYVSGAIKKIDVAVYEAAESLGCHGVRIVSTVVLPLVTPTAVASALMVFMNCMADFGTPALIGEGYDVLPTKIYIEFVGESGGSAHFASAMAMLMIVITATLYLLQKYYVNKKSFTMSSMRPVQPSKLGGPRNVLMHAFIYVLVAMSIIPQAVVVWTSFRKTEVQYFVEGYSLDSYRKIFSTALSSIRNTYLYCFIALIIIIVLGMLIAYLSVRRRNAVTNLIDTLAMFPYIVPGSVLGITLLLAFNGKGDPFILSGTALIIIVSLVIRRLAYTLRSSSAILYQISPSVEEAAISLGDTPLHAFVKVTAKMMMPGVVSGAILSWITLINELSSSVMLYTASTRTMSVAIYNEVIRASYGTAAALASILTATTVISLVAFFKISGSKDVTM
ncbi:MAG: ABC transporter permease [Candidatus Ventricola sp.]